MADEAAGSVLVKQNCVRILQNNYDNIFVQFPVKLNIRENQNGVPEGYLYVDVYPETVSKSDWQSDFLTRLQSYVDDICKESETTAAEDSSYDSDYDGDDKPSSSSSLAYHHHDVSRTVSDTLGAEFAEYVSHGPTPAPPSTPGYHARVEFALKLGYTERLVQVALAKLGADPGQNELLAELIKLGAQGPRLPEGLLDAGGDCGDMPQDVGETAGCLLRPVVIDGSNVAMSHGNKEVFSCRGIKLCVDWFLSRGHSEITVFVPKWRKEGPRPDNPITDQEILSELERDRYLVFTPSRLVGGKRMVCYDDRYILRLAVENEGIVVSNDNYRDLAQENPEFKKVVEERILMYSFVNDRFMPPDDPLGRTGPTLDNFLRIQPRKGDPPRPCPYGKKCTYGNKCKYYHPERGALPHKSVTEMLVEHAQRHLQARGDPSPLKGKSLSLPLSSDDSGNKNRKTPLSRTKSVVPQSKDQQQQQMMSSVPKSHSVENVAGPGQSMSLRSRGHATQEQEDGAANLHRKLQRQLTLNPNYDPRLYQMRRGYVGSTTVQHRPLTRHSSNAEGQNQYALQMQMQQQNNSCAQAWDLHQSVTRIASAPDSFRPWPPGPPPMHRHMQRLSSTSDPQINLCVPPSTNWQQVLWPPQPQPQQPVAAYSAEDARHKMHYHLSAIFPEEQVHQAMQLYPDETNPQKICAAILAMFPKDSLG